MSLSPRSKSIVKGAVIAGVAADALLATSVGGLIISKGTVLNQPLEAVFNWINRPVGEFAEFLLVFGIDPLGHSPLAAIGLMAAYWACLGVLVLFVVKVPGAAVSKWGRKGDGDAL